MIKDDLRHFVISAFFLDCIFFLNPCLPIKQEFFAHSCCVLEVKLFFPNPTQCAGSCILLPLPFLIFQVKGRMPILRITALLTQVLSIIDGRM